MEPAANSPAPLRNRTGQVPKRIAVLHREKAESAAPPMRVPDHKVKGGWVLTYDA